MTNSHQSDLSKIVLFALEISPKTVHYKDFFKEIMQPKIKYTQLFLNVVNQQRHVWYWRFSSLV